jgi:hypothetical protein
MTTKPSDSIHPLQQQMGNIGLTKREYFAALAIQGLCANPHHMVICANAKEMAKFAVQQADALIEALNK